MHKIIIREAKPEDAKRLCELGNEFLKHLEGDSPLLKLEKLNLSKASIKSWQKGLEKPPKDFFTFVAEKDNKILGYMELMIKDNEPLHLFKIKKFGWIEAVVVDKKFRNQKIGKQLYEYAIKLFKNKNITYIRLSVFLKNELGHSFWIRKGFKEESVEMIKKL